MSEIGNRLRNLFTEIAPPIDVEGIVQTPGVPAEARRGWLVALAAAAMVLVFGMGSFLLFDGSDRPAETADGSPATVDTSHETSTPSTFVESTTTVPENGFVPQVIRPVRIKCTSEVANFPCSALVDGDETTRWNAVEGGVGAEIVLFFYPPVQITSIDLFNVGDAEAFSRNARIRGLEIVFDDLPQATVIELNDAYAQSVQVETLRTSIAVLHVTSAYPGQAYEGKEPFTELALAEIQVWGRVAPEVTTLDEVPTTSTADPSTPEIALVPPGEWPQPALDPVVALSACEVSDVGDFIYEEFPDLGGLPTTTLTVAEVAEVMPLPRIGLHSVFSVDLADWCFSALQVDDVSGWELQGPESGQHVFAAARPRESNSVPDGVIDDYYHQSRIASGQGFNVSVRPEGRAVGVVDHDYFVMAGGELHPEGDTYLWGERLAMSLYKAPFEEEGRDGPFSGGLFDPAGLPESYGPCMTTWLVWEQSGEGAEWNRTAYCDGRGGYIEILNGFGGDYPPMPEGADEWGASPGTGVTWIESGRRNIAFDIDGQPSLGVWVTGPETLSQETLSAVVRSMLLFRPELTDPRKGDASFSDAVDPEAAVRPLIAEAVSTAPDGLAIGTNQWSDDGEGGDMLGNALALGANLIERLDYVDVVVADMGYRVQAIFSCGGLWFNVHIEPDPPPQRSDPGWSRSEGRYESIVDWLLSLERTLGCVSGPIGG